MGWLRVVEGRGIARGAGTLPAPLLSLHTTTDRPVSSPSRYNAAERLPGGTPRHAGIPSRPYSQEEARMVLRRRLVERKRQVLVAVPAEVRELLAVAPGEGVYWHLTHRGAAVLSRSAGTSAGRPVDPATTRRVHELERQVKRLRARLDKHSVADYNTAFGQGVEHGLRLGPLWRSTLDRLHADQHTMAGQVGEILALLRASRVRPRRRAPDAPSADAHPSAPPPSADVVIDGGAGTSGAEPPGAPPQS